MPFFSSDLNSVAISASSRGSKTDSCQARDAQSKRRMRFVSANSVPCGQPGVESSDTQALFASVSPPAL